MTKQKKMIPKLISNNESERKNENLSRTKIHEIFRKFCKSKIHGRKLMDLKLNRLFFFIAKEKGNS